jgi:hypothetical protein
MKIPRMGLCRKRIDFHRAINAEAGTLKAQ